MAIAGSCPSRTRSGALPLVFLPYGLSVSIDWFPRDDMDVAALKMRGNE